MRAAELGALASVPGSTEHESRCQAEAGEGITERAVDEGLVLEAGLLLDQPPHVGETRLARQHDPGGAEFSGNSGGGGALNGRLRRSVYGYSRMPIFNELREAPVLDYDRIGREAAEEREESGSAYRALLKNDRIEGGV